MDHTYETMVVEWPDGTYTRGIDPTSWDTKDLIKHEALLATRVDDARFVLTQLGNIDIVKQLVPDATIVFDTNRAAIFGHSFGGATAISALMKDGRFKGALNMDGSQYGPLSKTVLPVVLFGRGEPDPRNRSNNPTWDTLCHHLTGWLKEINLKECAHNTFSDLPLLIKLSGIEVKGFAKEMVGRLDGERSFGVIMACIRAFMGFVLKDEGAELYNGPSDEYAEIEFG
ncbi:hypothetical protein N0V90_013497 [Kalmusia sp. IMI 367209]|nr:hypothetical protein N0V90_013497 [Kalmusia sp. IMI 367209]